LVISTPLKWLNTVDVAPVEKKPLFKNVGVRAATALLFSAICIPPLYFGGWPWAVLVALLGGRMMWEWVRMSDDSPTRLAYIVPIIGIAVACFYMAQENLGLAVLTVAIAAIVAAIERSRRGGLLWAGLGYLYIVIPSLAMWSGFFSGLGFGAIIGGIVGLVIGLGFPTCAPRRAWRNSSRRFDRQ